MESSRVPVLGEQKIKATPNVIASMVRHLDDDGTFEPESSQFVGGQAQAIAGRSNLMSGEDLVEMLLDELKPALREIVREELARAKPKDARDMTVQEAADALEAQEQLQRDVSVELSARRAARRPANGAINRVGEQRTRP